jgi:Trypsin
MVMSSSWAARRATVVAALACVLLATALISPAHSSIDPVFDGNEHPNVGLIVGLDETGNGIYGCTGTLVDSTTVLTAAHCVNLTLFPEVTEIVITFDAQLRQLPDGDYLIEHFVDGTGDPDPRWIPSEIAGDVGRGQRGFQDNAGFDIGLLHLSAPASTVAPGITPAPITAAGTNDRYQTGPKKELLVQVGYGVDREGPPGQELSYFHDFNRDKSLVTPKHVTPALLLLGSNPNNAIGYGSPCSGDSGSPVFRGSEIVSLFTFSQGTCQNSGGGVRVDAGPGRDFLRSRGLVP